MCGSLWLHHGQKVQSNVILRKTVVLWKTAPTLLNMRLNRWCLKNCNLHNSVLSERAIHEFLRNHNILSLLIFFDSAASGFFFFVKDKDTLKMSPFSHGCQNRTEMWKGYGLAYLKLFPGCIKADRNVGNGTLLPGTKKDGVET